MVEESEPVVGGDWEAEDVVEGASDATVAEDNADNLLSFSTMLLSFFQCCLHTCFPQVTHPIVVVNVLTESGSLRTHQFE